MRWTKEESRGEHIASTAKLLGGRLVIHRWMHNDPRDWLMSLELLPPERELLKQSDKLTKSVKHLAIERALLWAKALVRDLEDLLAGGWVCPKCGAPAHGHGRGECAEREQNHCEGLLCECMDDPSATTHGLSKLDPCHNARCYHCGWEGTMPARRRKKS